MMRSIIALCLLALLSTSAIAQQIAPNASNLFDTTLPGPFKSGRFYGPLLPVVPTNQALGGANILYAEPFFVGSTSLLQTLSFDIGTGIAGAWNARMCVYYDSGTGTPGGLVANGDTGTIAIGSGSVTGVKTSSTINTSGLSLPGPGWYWFAFMADTSGQSLYSASGAGLGATRLHGDSVSVGLYNGVANWGFSMAQTFGACPSSMASATVLRNAPVVFIEAGF
jgi:hypothetical protein